MFMFVNQNKIFKVRVYNFYNDCPNLLFRHDSARYERRPQLYHQGKSKRVQIRIITSHLNMLVIHICSMFKFCPKTQREETLLFFSAFLKPNLICSSPYLANITKMLISGILGLLIPSREDSDLSDPPRIFKVVMKHSNTLRAADPTPLPWRLRSQCLSSIPAPKQQAPTAHTFHPQPSCRAHAGGAPSPEGFLPSCRTGIPRAHAPCTERGGPGRGRSSPPGNTWGKPLCPLLSLSITLAF